MRFKITLSILLAASAVAGCGPVNRGLESVNQPIVERQDFVFDIPSSSVGLSDQQKLAAWFDSLRLGYGDRVSIDDHSSYGINVAARDAIASVLARYGMLLSDHAPITAGSVNAGGIRVVVSRSKAAVPHCPDWRRDSQPEFASSTMSNFGCATNTNLAAMVANPEDLVRGHPVEDDDAATVSKGIKSYRDADPTGKGGLKREAN